ncbi:MAG: XdhC/CoxI family protein [Chloroflexota bacterium]|jgi:xanthine dehydrogenase accessory factor
MKEIIKDVDAWLSSGETEIALATVLSTWGSAPRKIGAKMACTATGAAISGSVSGGCIEGAVIAAGDEVLANGQPQLLRFGVADETAWEVGLACGGTIEVFVERLDIPIYSVAREWVINSKQGTIVTVVGGSEKGLGRKVAIEDGHIVAGSLGPLLDETAMALVIEGAPTGVYMGQEKTDLFLDGVRPWPQLVIIGGAHIAVILAQLGKLLGYRVVVIDPRRAFGNQVRFPDVDQLIQSWPGKALAGHPLSTESAIVTLSHDPKIDDPALQAALNSPAFYIGALGSRRTHARRCERLVNMGYKEKDLARIHAPVGLDIGADNPEEIALAIMGEIVAAYREKVGR